MVDQIENTFGQVLRVGDVVGWGHRDGNSSRQQVGIILEIDQKHPLPNVLPDLVENRAKCYWIGGGGRGEYKSNARAEDLFLLDGSTLGTDMRQKISLARSSQLPS